MVKVIFPGVLYKLTNAFFENSKEIGNEYEGMIRFLISFLFPIW